jgi:hypothetical protein
MTLTEWIGTNGQLIQALISGILLILVLRGRSRLKDTEARATRATNELEETKNQGAMTRAILDLLSGQIANTAQLARAIEDRNILQKVDSDGHAKVVEGVMQNNARVIELITSFQDFSREQHQRTRVEIGGKVDTVEESLNSASHDAAEFRKVLNGRWQRLEPALQERFDSLERHISRALERLPQTGELNPADVPDAPPAEPPTAAAA